MKLQSKVRVSIADDHPVFRSGLRQIIEEEPNIEIVSEDDNGLDALKSIMEKLPDVAILDIDMPELTGIEVLRKLKEKECNAKVVFLTVYADEDLFDEGMELGMIGYVLKDSAVSEIHECIYKVFHGDYYVSPKMTDILVKRKKKDTKGRPEFLDLLTPTEIIVLKQISQGLTSREIAEQQNSSFKTIENHRANISGKLNLSGANSLLQFAINNKDKF
jgi:DNA-binding NarL/FixJ family response regulator